MPRMRVVLVLPAIAVLATGCATKDWVNSIVSKERIATDGRVGQVEQRVDAEGRRISGSVDALGARVKTVEETGEATRGLATGARERADGAFARADGAMAKATDLDGRLTRLWASRHKRSVVDSTKVHFGFDRFDLDDGAQTALLTTVDELRKNPALAVVLEGYTDPQGARSYNLELSRRRVEAVQRYLVSRGVELWRINSLGVGPLDGAAPNAEKRRVTVTLTVAE